MSFDHLGDYLSVGDHDGRVIIFKFTDKDEDGYPNLSFYDEILAFDPDYDYAGLIEIPPKVNALSWIPTFRDKYSWLLVANDKYVKLFSVQTQ